MRKLIPVPLGDTVIGEGPITKETRGGGAILRLLVEGRAVEAVVGGVKGGTVAVDAGAVRAHQGDEILDGEALALEDGNQLGGRQRRRRDLVGRVGLRGVLAADEDFDGWAGGTGRYCHTYWGREKVS